MSMQATFLISASPLLSLLRAKLWQFVRNVERETHELVILSQQCYR